MADASADSAGVVVPPPIVYALGFGIGYALDRFKPAPVAVGGARILLGWVFAGVCRGVALGAASLARPQPARIERQILAGKARSEIARARVVRRRALRIERIVVGHGERDWSGRPAFRTLQRREVRVSRRR